MAQPFSPPPHVDTQSPNSFTSFSWVVAERGVVVPAGGRLDRRRLHGRKREDHDSYVPAYQISIKSEKNNTLEISSMPLKLTW